MTADEKKRVLRPIFKEKRAAAHSEEKSELICRRLLGLSQIRFAKTVLLYAPIQSEPSLYPLFLKLAQNKEKILGFPRTLDGRKMVFHRVFELSSLEKGRFGVPEPSPLTPRIEKSLITEGDVCLVPALAFDRDGFRLGYGGGYYDRFLSDFKGIKLGIAYDCCIADRLERDEHDIKVDYIITESRVDKT